MKIITVEEHYTVPQVDAYCAQAKAARSGATPPQTPSHADAGILGELGEKRLAAMDRSGITAQIIGYGGNSPMHLRKEEDAVTYCRIATTISPRQSASIRAVCMVMPSCRWTIPPPLPPNWSGAPRNWGWWAG